MAHEHGHTLYRFFTEAGVLLYVGITSRGYQRVREHSKDKEWWPTVATATMTHYTTRQELEAAELQAIWDEGPLHNKAHTQRQGVDATVQGTAWPFSSSPTGAFTGQIQVSKYHQS